MHFNMVFGKNILAKHSFFPFSRTLLMTRHKPTRLFSGSTGLRRWRGGAAWPADLHADGHLHPADRRARVGDEALRAPARPAAPRHPRHDVRRRRPPARLPPRHAEAPPRTAARGVARPSPARLRTTPAAARGPAGRRRPARPRPPREGLRGLQGAKVKQLWIYGLEIVGMMWNRSEEEEPDIGDGENKYSITR